MASTIFVVDSSPAVRRLVEQISKQEGCDVQGFQDGPAALQAARHTSPNLIIADYHLENMTFSGFCKEVHKLDNLAENYIISLTSPSDRVDETHMRSLGVKAFLNKPFQSEALLDVIKDLKKQQTARASGAKKKSRSWPPVTSGTDSDDDSANEDNPAEQEEKPVIMPHPQPKHAPAATTTPAQTPTAEPEEAMMGLFGQLLHSMSERTEKKIADLLPQMVGKDLATLVARAVEAEVRTQTGTSLSEKRLTQALEPLLVTALSQKMSLLEPIIRQSVLDTASPLIKERIDQCVREEIAAVRRSLPDMVREQLGSLEGLVKEEVQQAAAKQTAGIAEALVRVTAREQVEQAVLRLVPNLAEEQIKAEIVRLTQAA